VAEQPLKGLRILLVEDTAIVAMTLRRALVKEGCELVAQCDSLRAALAAANADAGYSGALLDVNLRGELVFPAAEQLQRRGVPIIFLTGYSGEFLPERFAACPILEKPFSGSDLRRIMMKTFIASGNSSLPDSSTPA
jgi:CheY-like chemotaxis protein